MKKLLRNNKGFSLAEILVSTGIVAIGGVVLFKTGAITHLTTKKAETTSNISLLVDDLIKGSTNLLAKSEDKQGNKVRGICPLVSTTANSPGVGAIFIDFKNSSKVFKDSNWDNFLTSWNESQHKECDIKGAWGKCYKINHDKLASSFSKSQIEEQDINATVAIYPVNMNPNTNGGNEVFKKLSINEAGRFDAKDIGFEINATVYFNNEHGNRVKKVMSDFFWAPNVGLCDYTLPNDRKVKLSLNGAGASDPSGLTIYNRSGFTGNLKEPIDINWKKTQAQAGLITNNGNFITTDSSQNIFGSCNETRYRCPQVNSKSRVYGPINLFTNIQYNEYNKINNGNYSKSMRINPRIQLKKAEGGDLVNYEAQSYNFDNKEKEIGTPSVINSSHTLAFTINDKNRDNATGICKKVCTESTNYNTNDASWEDRYTPFLKVNFVSGKNGDTFSYSSGQELGCTACYMKNCSQFGIGTFGPMAKMPTHPLDSSLPECSLKEDRTLVNSPAVLFGTKKVGTPWGASSSKCISAKLNKATNQLEYSAEDCDQKLPVLCYNFGGYRLAKDISADKEALSYVTYNEAPRRCFSMGREVARVSELDQYLGKSFSAPKNADGNYDFINLSQQGIFLAPQFKQDIVDLGSWFTTNGISNNKKFWVAMVRDGKDNIMARAPIAPNYTPQDKYALYFSVGGALESKTYPQNLGIAQSAGAKGFILSHHVKFKGLFPSALEKPFGARRIPFLCRRKRIDGNFFISKNKSTDQDKGDSICKLEGGLFIPPTTPVGWVSAMNALNSFSPRYGFPNPDQTTVDSIPFAWVGMKANGSPLNYDKNWFYASTDLKQVGLTTKYTPTGADNGYTVINGDGEYINPRAELTGNPIDPDDIELAPNSSFQITTYSHLSQSKNLNTTTSDVEKDLPEWKGIIDSALSGVDIDIKDAYGSKKKLVLSGKKPGPGNYVNVTLGSTSRKFGFKYNSKSAKSPEGSHLCLTGGDGKVSRISYYSTCSGHIIKKDQMIGSKSGRALLNIIGLSAFDLIDLPQ